MRVLVVTGSVVDLTVNLSRSVIAEEVNSSMWTAANGPLKRVLDYVEDPIVSSDIIGDPHSSIFVSNWTQVMSDKMVKVVSWYDNEWGYSSRTVDLISKVGEFI